MNPEMFKYKTVNLDKLAGFGFHKELEAYRYNTTIVDGQFEMTVLISESGTVDTKVLDCDSGAEYVLHRMAGTAGAFIGMVRSAHDEVLQSIADACFEPDVFKSDTAHGIIRYVRDTYGDELEFLWQKSPDSAVWRRKDTKKWYGVFMIVSKRKLGVDSDEPAEIIDLHMEPEVLETLVDGKRYFPGFHMNKKHWCTVILDGTMPVEEICDRIDESYQLALK